MRSIMCGHIPSLNTAAFSNYYSNNYVLVYISYDNDSGSGLQLHTQSSPGERSGKFSQNGKFGQTW